MQIVIVKIYISYITAQAKAEAPASSTTFVNIFLPFFVSRV